MITLSCFSYPIIFLIDLTLFSADKWVCILYQILIWNFLLAISQDALTDYMKDVVHQDYFVNQAGYYCVDIIQLDALNSIQFLLDYIVS